MTGELTLRPAGPGDADLLLALRNDPAAQAASFDTAEIPRETHLAWLERKLADTRARVYVAELDGAPVGQVRVDTVSEGLGEISLAVDAAARGRGVGRALIADASVRAAAELQLARIQALIRLSNESSLRAFHAAGYGDERLTARGGEEAWILTWAPAA